ncbi:glutathione S-transferase T1-like [Capsicum galapagoense]
MQLEDLDEKDRERIIGPYKRVLKWIYDTKNAMEPHFQEVTSMLSKRVIGWIQHQVGVVFVNARNTYFIDLKGNKKKLNLNLQEMIQERFRSFTRTFMREISEMTVILKNCETST